jgi:hypothetical protein
VPHSWAVKLVLAGLALAQQPALAQEPLSIESVARSYFATSSYCDAGKRGWRDNPKQPFVEELAFERCASRDGRFKYVERNPRTGASAKWSDAKRYYRYLEWGGRYQDLALNDAFVMGLYSDPGQVYPVFVFELFTSNPGRLPNSAERTTYLRSYAPAPALSTAEHSVFERSEPGMTFDQRRTVWLERIWVDAGRQITRYERLNDEGIVRYVEVASRSIDRPLARADLWYEAPLLKRFSLQNNLPVFLAALHVAAGLAGALLWGWLLARSEVPEDALYWRGRLWRFWLWTLVVAVVLLGAFAILVSGGSGHPPPIVLAFVGGMWAAVALGMWACFILASYPLELAFRAARGSSAESG